MKAKPACTAESAEEGEASETDVEANTAETLPPMIPDLSREPVKAKLAYTDESPQNWDHKWEMWKEFSNQDRTEEPHLWC